MGSPYDRVGLMVGELGARPAKSAPELETEMGPAVAIAWWIAEALEPPVCGISFQKSTYNLADGFIKPRVKAAL